jgi:hypothetical protein
MRSDLRAGTVTFLFTDVEGSTKLMEEIGEKRSGLRDTSARSMLIRPSWSCQDQGGHAHA